MTVRQRAMATETPLTERPSRLSRLFPDSQPVASRYSLGAILGQGTFGTVRKCVEHETRIVAACKSVDKWPPGGYSQNHLSDIVAEVTVMRCLGKYRSPHIVALKNVYEDSESVHMVMDFCKGGDLDQFLVDRGGRPMGEGIAAGIFRQLAAAVKVCHVDAGVLHRDIKPQNVLIAHRIPGKNGRDEEMVPEVKLADFGRSMLIGRDGEETSGQVTTYNFSAPETIPPLKGEFCTAAVRRRRGNYGFPADIWSLGVSLYLMLSGHLPFSSDHHFAEKENEGQNQALFRAILRGYTDLSSGPWVTVSSQAKSLISRMLSSDPRKRPTIEKVLEHPWLQAHYSSLQRNSKFIASSISSRFLLPNNVRNVHENLVAKDTRKGWNSGSVSDDHDFRKKTTNALQWRSAKKADAIKEPFSDCSNSNASGQHPLFAALPSHSHLPPAFCPSSASSTSPESPSSSSSDESSSNWDTCNEILPLKSSGEERCLRDQTTGSLSVKIETTECRESVPTVPNLPPSVRPLPPLKCGSLVTVSYGEETSGHGVLCSRSACGGNRGTSSQAKSYRSLRSTSLPRREQQKGA